MNNEVNIKEEHIHTSDYKLKYLGYGEWVEEPDDIQFNYKGFHCKISRILKREYPNNCVYFGGHLCGYVNIPQDHTMYGKKYDDINIDCHGGLTFSEFKKEDNTYWIGFDCAHLGDYVPSMGLFKNTHPIIKAFGEAFPIPEEYKDLSIFNPVYRNVNFCINECKSIVDQLIEMRNIESRNSIPTS